MTYSVKSLGPGELQEINKWIKMGFTNGQIAKKMATNPQKISVIRKHLQDHPID